MIKKFSALFLLGILLFLNSCESTGICTEPITPKFVIGFAGIDNLGNPIDIMPPNDLMIYGNRDGKDIIGSNPEYKYIFPNITQADPNTGKISLIFDVNKDELTYIFRFESFSPIIFDTLKISYTRVNQYVSKNCGYKTIFNNVKIDYNSTNAIDKIILLSENIEYDVEKHLKIYLK